MNHEMMNLEPVMLEVDHMMQMLNVNVNANANANANVSANDDVYFDQRLVQLVATVLDLLLVMSMKELLNLLAA